MLRVFLESIDADNYVTIRVVKALKDYHPQTVALVNDYDQADLVIFHVVGRLARLRKRAEDLLAQNKRFALIQYELRDTKNPQTADWLWLWQRADVVWTFYDLYDEIRKDGLIPPTIFTFCRPLGANSEIFHAINRLPCLGEENDRGFTVCTCGRSYLREAVRECILASRAFSGMTAHFGTYLGIEQDVSCFPPMCEEDRANLFRHCRFISGLSNSTAHSTQVVEGLLCGARPVLFDTPFDRQWYGEFGLFIPSGARRDVLVSLKKVFGGPCAPLSDSQLKLARERFGWQSVIEAFWQCLV